MNEDYSKNAEAFKALADPNRLKIISMLCSDELCACNILEKFDITQPTLSHHMKTLCDSRLVTERKEGKWVYYSIDSDKLTELQDFLKSIVGSNCKCKKGECNCEK